MALLQAFQALTRRGSQANLGLGGTKLGNFWNYMNQNKKQQTQIRRKPNNKENRSKECRPQRDRPKKGAVGPLGAPGVSSPAGCVTRGHPSMPRWCRPGQRSPTPRFGSSSERQVVG